VGDRGLFGEAVLVSLTGDLNLSLECPSKPSGSPNIVDKRGSTGRAAVAAALAAASRACKVALEQSSEEGVAEAPAPNSVFLDDTWSTSRIAGELFRCTE
jgi:hypothetical protein